MTKIIEGEEGEKLFRQVGEMARGIHSVLSEIKQSLSPDAVTMHSTNVPDAAIKLEKILDLTNKAAHETMETAEKQLSSIREWTLENEATKNLLLEQHPDLSVLLLMLLARISSDEVRLKNLENLSMSLVMTQSYQDITGQSLKKVITLLSGLEKQLVTLIKELGDEEVQKTERNTDLAQDDIDSILNDFGF